MASKAGRPSKLTDAQWNELLIRHFIGKESPDALAKEFKINKTTVYDKLSGQGKEIKDVANQLVAADQKLKSLPISAQLTALNLVDELKSVSLHLAGAAKFGAATAHRLSMIANGKIEKLDDADPSKDGENLVILRNVMAFTTAANEAAKIGTNLIAANKVMVEKANTDTEPDTAFAPVTQQQASSEYQRIISGR